VVGPELLDRKVAPEQAALGSEELDRLLDDWSHAIELVAAGERAEAGELDVHVGTPRQLCEPAPPCRTACVGVVLRHAGVQQHEGRLRKGVDQVERMGVLAREHLQLEQQATRVDLRRPLRQAWPRITSGAGAKR
jgi:hypothetical protein